MMERESVFPLAYTINLEMRFHERAKGLSTNGDET